MSRNLERIDELLRRHFDEAAGGIVDKSPSRLVRGEATEKEYFILKVDLVGSTQLLLARRKATYLKFAHTFLSTIDKITQDCGAEAEQVEYAGDSVLAYFPADDVRAEDVIRAVCFSRSAITRMQRLDGALGAMRLHCRAVMHHDTLLVSRIGPRANSTLTAIGFPLHRVAKLEKQVGVDIGWATAEFHAKVERTNRKYLEPVYEEKQVPIPQPIFRPEPPPPVHAQGLASVLFPKHPPPQLGQNALAGMLHSPHTPSLFQQLTVAEPRYTIERKLIGAKLNWGLLFRDLELIPPLR